MFQGCFAASLNDLSFTNDTFNSDSVSISASSVTTQGRRSAQEDRISMYKKKYQWGCAVFDGHGGERVAERLSQSADGLLPYVMDDTNASLSVTEKYKKFNEDNFPAPKFNNVGSTAVTFQVDDLKKKIFMAHCGDSLGLLINRTTGEIIYQTVAHSPKSEEGRIKKLGGFVSDDNRVNGILAVSRSFGDRVYEGYDIEKYENNGEKLVIPDPDVFEASFTDLPEQMVGLLFSDGFPDYFSSNSNDHKYSSEFLTILAKITVYLLQNDRPIDSLAKELVLLMNTRKTLDEIKKDLFSKSVSFNDLSKETTVHFSRDNVSLVAFEINKKSEIVNHANKP